MSNGKKLKTRFYHRFRRYAVTQLAHDLATVLVSSLIALFWYVASPREISATAAAVSFVTALAVKGGEYLDNPNSRPPKYLRYEQKN